MKEVSAINSLIKELEDCHQSDFIQGIIVGLRLAKQVFTRDDNFTWFATIMRKKEGATADPKS